MNRFKSFTLLVILFSLSFFMMQCKHEFPNPNPGGNTGTPTETSTCSADTVYFGSEILPMINSNCATSGCHDLVTHKEGIILTDYAHIVSRVSPFNAERSSLYTVCVRGGERMPPKPMAALTQAQLTKMIIWINQGALNNNCTGGCDTTSFTYSGAVSVTINSYCKGCHNPASLGGGIDLSTYAAVKAAAGGRLMGSILHTAGFSAMPKGGSQLSDCQVTQIEKWIQAGTPNN
jgi:mono/diheme cytochrome c family protein